MRYSHSRTSAGIFARIREPGNSRRARAQKSWWGVRWGAQTSRQVDGDSICWANFLDGGNGEHSSQELRHVALLLRVEIVGLVDSLAQFRADAEGEMYSVEVIL